MNPERRIEFEAKEARNLRMIISTGLVLVLCAIVGTYIYYGMQFARESAPADIAVESDPVLSPDATTIFQALESAPIASAETTQVIKDALSQNEPVPTPEAAAMREALGHPAP
jgi:hypothetical protein